MIKIRERFNPAPEQARLNAFGKEMEAEGEEHLANFLVKGLDVPRVNKLIYRPEGSDVAEDAVRRLAKSALNNPDEEFNTIVGHPDISQEYMFGFKNQSTGKQVPGLIGEKTKICLVEDFDRLQPEIQEQLMREAFRLENETNFYLMAKWVDPNPNPNPPTPDSVFDARATGSLELGLSKKIEQLAANLYFQIT